MPDETTDTDGADDAQHENDEEAAGADGSAQRTDTFGRPIRYVDPTEKDWSEAHAFAGIGTAAFSDEPDSYEEARADEITTRLPLADTITLLNEHFNVTTRGVAYRDENSAWSETDRHIALVNPATDALYHIPTQQYSPATPHGLYSPLVSVLRERGMHAFGEIRVRRGGGDQHMDVFIGEEATTVEVDAGEATRQLVLGFEVSHDYFGGRRHTASPIALDADSGAILRDILPARKRMHTGNATDDVGAWYADMLDLLEASTDRLVQAIADANDYTLDAVTDPDVPIDAEEVYALMDFPAHNDGSLAECAGDRLRARMHAGFGEAPDAPTAWQVFHAGADAITHDYEAQRGGGAINERVTALNRMLFVPESAERDILSAARDDLLDELSERERNALDRGLSSFVDDETEAEYEALGDRLDALDGSVSEYKSVKGRLNALMTAAENEISEEAETAEDDEEAAVSDVDQDQDGEQAMTDGGSSTTDHTLGAFTSPQDGDDA